MVSLTGFAVKKSYVTLFRFKGSPDSIPLTSITISPRDFLFLDPETRFFRCANLDPDIIIPIPYNLLKRKKLSVTKLTHKEAVKAGWLPPIKRKKTTPGWKQ